MCVMAPGSLRICFFGCAVSSSSSSSFSCVCSFPTPPKKGKKEGEKKKVLFVTRRYIMSVCVSSTPVFATLEK